MVRGELIDALSGEPVEGAMIVLLDESDAVLERTMTGPDGTFVFAARHSGRSRVRADRIGHESTFSATFELPTDAPLELSLRAEVRAIELSAIDVDADPRCVLRPEEGRAVARVWGEARKSLEANVWSVEQGVLEYELVAFERLWDRERRRLRDQRLRRRVVASHVMFASQPAEVLVARGFVVEDGTDRIYNGPDATVMLSDAFLDTHCFRLASTDPDEPRIALEFEPVEGRELTEIEGAMWLHRSTAELESIEYRYKNTHRRFGERRFGGSIEFDRLPTGLLIVRRWAIRMPEAERRLGWRREVLRGVREQGAEVLAVRAIRGATIRQYDAGVMEGTVTREPDNRPAAGVIVALQGVDAWAETDSAGTYRIGPTLPGPYVVTIDDPELSRVGHRVEDRRISVGRGEPTHHDVRLEHPMAVLFEYCGDRRDYTSTAVLVGRVRDIEGLRLIEDAAIRVRWTDRIGNEQRRNGESDNTGFYYVCGVPRETRVSVGADRDGVTSLPALITIPKGADQVVMDLAVGPPGSFER